MAHILRRRDKLKALVHYVISRCDDPASLGSIKLNKVLWVSDLWAYVQRGQPITGEQYVKQQFGPVASTVGILRELEQEGKIAVRKREKPGKHKTDYIELKSPDNLDLFTSEEISLVNEAIDFVCNRHTAMEISQKTHDLVWELADIGEEIPYEAMWASRLDGVTNNDVKWAKEISDAHPT